ncbi:MAG: hypothetical protein A3G24_25500 [Betaproteobacteria bacterium RIFCSPLOWO2_12_FULL_62_13]|nr:MAG: hypothetical protein A3G24_25500 [Betaproteobacteria bacterium RIFCSPLOWO2_12_FULL_62_13]
MSRQSTWLERVLFALGGVAVLVIGFFFLTVALVVGAFLAAAILARWWWIARKLKRQRKQEILEGEYEIVERSELEQSRSPTRSDSGGP